MSKPKMTHSEFVLKAIIAGARSQSKGIHVVYSGFNAAFKSYFDEEARPATAQLEKDGVIAMHGCRGGAMMYKAGEEPERKDDKAAKLLVSMGAA